MSAYSPTAAQKRTFHEGPLTANRRHGVTSTKEKGRQPRRLYFSSFVTSSRVSIWCAKAVQLCAMFVSTEDLRAEILGSFPRALYSAAYARHLSIVGMAICSTSGPEHNTRSRRYMATIGPDRAKYKPKWVPDVVNFPPGLASAGGSGGSVVLLVMRKDQSGKTLAFEMRSIRKGALDLSQTPPPVVQKP